MSKMVQPPPFEPTEIEAIALTNIAFMFADILILIVLIVLMIYSYKKLHFLGVIIIYLFSVLIGFESVGHVHTHFSPTLEIFFLLFQTSLLITSALEVYNKR